MTLEQILAKSIPQPNGCLEYPTKQKERRGTIDVGGKSISAARAVWILSGKPIPDGKYDVCHTCDNPPCVNIAHLFTGTRKQNMQDCSAKGRIHHPPKGQDHPYSKLTDAQIDQVRAMHASGVSQLELASLFNVSQGHVSKLVHKIRRPVLSTIIHKSLHSLQTNIKPIKS